MEELLLLMVGSIFWGLCSSLIGVLYGVVLAGDNNPLNFWFNWLRRWHERGGWREWVASPLGGCHICCSGQIALWSSTLFLPTLFHWRHGMVGPWHMPVPAHFSWTSAFLHLLAAGSAVLFAAFIGKLYKWTMRQL